jgi:hypothetical protein
MQGYHDANEFSPSLAAISIFCFDEVQRLSYELDRLIKLCLSMKMSLNRQA